MLGTFGETYQWSRTCSGTLAPVAGAMTWYSFTRFTWLLHQSWWFALGWRPYVLPGWWTAVAALLTIATAVGVTRRLFKDSDIDTGSRLRLGLAIAALAIQAFAVYWTYFRLGNGAQGRYLFPFIVPSLMLLWAGIDAWTPRPRRVYAVAALVVFFAILNVAAWTLVAIPAYYASF